MMTDSKIKLDSPVPEVGIALGGGGSKGLAHIPLLETLSEFNLNITEISGTSIGAIIGAFFAGGMPAKEIRTLFTELLGKREEKLRTWSNSDFNTKWYHLIKPNLKGSGLLKVDGFLNFLNDNLPVKNFEDLKIPMKIVAADFWSRKQVVFSQGEIIPAIQASMSIAGLFPATIINKRVLVDGGAVNPVPFDILRQDSFIIALDVLGYKTPPESNLQPSLFESIFNTYQIMEESIVNQKLHSHKPDIYLKPDIKNIRIFDFYKYENIFEQAQPSARLLNEQLQQLL